MIEDNEPTEDLETNKTHITANPNKNNRAKPSSKKQFILIGAACFVGLILIFGIIHVLTKKPNSNYHAGDNGNQQSAQSKPGQYSATAVLPFPNTVKSNGQLYATVNGQDYPTEFTAWGGHSLPHAGGHVEGNNKSNFRIHIEPSGKTVNMSNGSSTCGATDLCGVTAADAKANAPWYLAENSGMKLIAVEKVANQDLSPYIPGEGIQHRLYFSFDGGLNLNLQHVGEISPELLQLIHASGQDAALEASQYTQLTKPVDVSKGTKLARPQIIAVQSKQIAGHTIYQADAQTEWSITPTMVTTKDIACQWNYFSSDIKKQMQSVLDTELTHPSPNGIFAGTGTGNSVGVEAAAEGSLCASDTIAYSNYSKISSNNSFGYYKVNDSTQATGEVMAVYPINKTSAAYKANQSSYASSNVDFMFRRGVDVSGFANTSNFSFSLSEGSKTYAMHELSGEVLDMPTAADTSSNDHFTVHIDRGDNGATAATMPIGKFVGIRYKIQKDKVVMQYGQLADTAAAVKLPAAIPDNATCNADYACYIHDFSLLKQ
jgi:hypothetical protein